MGQRGEIFSTRIFADEGRKTYFFNVKENRYHDTYLNIVESRKTDNGFRRSSIVVFREDLDAFVKVLEKSVVRMQEGRGRVEEVLSVGGGRREYRLRSASKGKPALQISEMRVDATGSRREGIYVSVPALPVFMDGFAKALSVINS